ncbi:DUF202 domain-containing protein [Nocardia sp. CNY236]|uniref:DUF202 domain-containing protein n=1 Tax=Nocardia sp. CNY236 TaxID=1169152 RepID=UPI0003FAC3F7|nr:DUF202 domain-containing protein [Nocardia sp. CNY236]
MTPPQVTAPHLAAERTALAWRRTAIAAMVVAVAFVQAGAGSDRYSVAVGLIGAATTMAVLAGACYLRNRDLRRGRFTHGGRAVALTAVVVGVVALAACTTFAADLLELPP